MKIITSIFSLAFFLVFGVFAYTQEPSDTKKPQQQEERKPEAKSKQMKPEQEEAKPSKEERPQAKQKEERPQREEQPQRQEEAKRPQAEHEQHTAQARQGRQAGKGGHIPDDKFHASFGRQHTFVINRPVIVDNQPRFQYGGYWFEIVDPWPEDWAYTDDCYVDYVDGDYFLFNSLHPGERVVVFVVM
jgi:hypothetical protein